MDAVEWSLYRRLITALTDLAQTEATNLAAGYAKTYDEYRHRVGKAEAFRQAIQKVEAIQRDLRGDNPRED